MSVETRRLAAAQRTAAHSPRARRLRLASWLLIVPALSLFTFSVAAGAAGFGAKADYEQAARVVVPPGGGGDGELVAVDGGGSTLDRMLGGGSSRQLCWITKSQLQRVSAVYRTSRIGLGRLDVVAVYGANDRSLHALLGDVRCTLVSVNRVFYLPFDAHGS
jgi:hypothetical protein